MEPVILYYALAIPIAAAYACTLRRLKFDGRSIAILLGAFALSLSCFFNISNWFTFSTDWVAHAQYIFYIDQLHIIPPASFNAATRHPPAYYVIAALFYHLGEWAGDHRPLDYARYFSMILFCVFWVFSALTLRSVLPKRDTAYYYSLAMMAFWPIGLTKVTVIGCDILLYPAMMGVIYFLLRWLQEKHPSALSAAAMCAAVAVLSKNSGVVLVWMVGACMLAAIWQHHNTRGPLLRWDWIASIVIMVLCSHFTLARDVYLDIPPVQGSYALYDWLWMHFYFDPYEFTRDTMINPFAKQEMYHFWHYYLRSLLVGDYIGWRALALLFAYGIVWQAMVVYLIYSLWTRKRLPQGERYAWHFLLFMAAILTGMLVYRFHTLIQPNGAADARYIYPIITIIAAFYGKALQWFETQGRMLALRIGTGLALGFVLLSIALILAQDYLLTRIQ